MLNSDKEYLDKNGKKALLPEMLADMNDSDLLCSIIIPCYNYGRFLDEAVGSALSQTIENTEVIVVDDGSTDGSTKGVVSKFVGHPKVKVIFQENSGLSAARNTGINRAKVEQPWPNCPLVA